MDAELAKKARLDLYRLYSYPPFDPLTNFLNPDQVRHQLRVTYNMPVEELEKASGFRERVARWKLAREAADKILD